MAVNGCIVTIVGCGPGSMDYVTPAARKAIDGAEVLVGAQRLLNLFPHVTAERIVVTGKISEALDKLETRRKSKTVAVLVTGDPGVFSLARLVIKRFTRDCCRVIPGVSSIQMAFAKIGLDWIDAKIISAHKQDPTLDPSLRSADKIAVLGGRKESLSWIAHNLLDDSTDDRRIFVMENLTLEDERIREVDSDELATFDVVPSTIVLLVRKSLLEP